MPATKPLHRARRMQERAMPATKPPHRAHRM